MRRAFFVALLLGALSLVGLTPLTATASSAPQSQCPAGSQQCPPNYTCTVVGRPGHCHNSGIVAEGRVYGCTYDIGTGVSHWVELQAYHTYAVRYIFHQPVYNRHDSHNNLNTLGWTYFQNQRDESASIVTFSVIRRVDTPKARMLHVEATCVCPCGLRGQVITAPSWSFSKPLPFDDSNVTPLTTNPCKGVGQTCATLEKKFHGPFHVGDCNPLTWWTGHFQQVYLGSHTPSGSNSTWDGEVDPSMVKHGTKTVCFPEVGVYKFWAVASVKTPPDYPGQDPISPLLKFRVT